MYRRTMTGLYKAILAVTAVALSVAAVHQNNQAAILRVRGQSLQQQQELMGEENRQLRTDAEEAARGATALRSGGTLAKSETAELLRLRSEVTRLSAELRAAASTKQAQDSSEGTVKLFLDRLGEL